MTNRGLYFLMWCAIPVRRQWLGEGNGWKVCGRKRPRADGNCCARWRGDSPPKTGAILSVASRPVLTATTSVEMEFQPYDVSGCMGCSSRRHGCPSGSTLLAFEWDVKILRARHDGVDTVGVEPERES